MASYENLQAQARPDPGFSTQPRLEPHGSPERGSWATANWAAPASMSTTGTITAYPLREVWLIEMDAPYRDVSEELDRCVETALAESPRGVVFGLPNSVADTVPAELDVLASSGRHMRDWPPTPVVLSCRDPGTAALLAGRPNSEYLIHSTSILKGWTQIMNTEPVSTAHLRLDPTPLAPRTARNFLTLTCLEWGLTLSMATAELVISELVTNALQHASTTMEVILGTDQSRLRIGVRDWNPAPPSTRATDLESVNGRGLRLVSALSQHTGALPTKDGGKLVWAVLGR
jgi:anti-sigma regulatory factor (Ser/Thr protein kinase)